MYSETEFLFRQIHEQKGVDGSLLTNTVIRKLDCL